MRTGIVHVYPSAERRQVFVGVSLPAYGAPIDAPERADVAQRVSMSNGELRLIVYVYVEALNTDFLRSLARMIAEGSLNFDWRKKPSYVAF